jgi:hypothetical protein
MDMFRSLKEKLLLAGCLVDDNGQVQQKPPSQAYLERCQKSRLDFFAKERINFSRKAGGGKEKHIKFAVSFACFFTSEL